MADKKYTLCGICNKKIHVKDFGGVGKEDGFFHMKCFEEKYPDYRQGKCEHKGLRRSDPLGGFFCVDCDSFINKK